jgi:hypothetical protein
MNVLNLIASALNRNDDIPNIQLAEEIVKSNRAEWVKELVENLNHKDKNIQSDCIKALYETGAHGGAGLIAPFYKDFGNLLKSKNNRLVWGAMYALDAIASVKPTDVYSILPNIIKAVDKGSVITIDCGVSIFARLAAVKDYAETAFPLLMEQLKRCPAKQLPMYAEKSTQAINADNKNEFIKLIQKRYSELDKDSQKKRIDKVLKAMK